MAYVAVILLFLVLAAGSAAGTAPRAVVIEATHLDPPVVTVSAEQRVTFVNRAGHAAHVDFAGDTKQHHMFYVSGSVWAVFHRPGRHPYVVHFETGGGAPLRGVVEVMASSAVVPTPTCSSIVYHRHGFVS